MAETYFFFSFPILQTLQVLNHCNTWQFCTVQFCKNWNLSTIVCIVHIQTVCVLCCQDAPHFNTDGKLKDILKVTPGACLQYAVIEGNQALTVWYRQYLIAYFFPKKMGTPSLLLILYYVCICAVGAVQPVDEPLTSHFQKEIVGVLQKFMLREHRLVWNGLSRTWWDL